MKPLDYLAPFLELIRSKETSAPVTEVALSSVHKMLIYDMFGESSGWVKVCFSCLTWTGVYVRIISVEESIKQLKGLTSKEKARTDWEVSTSTVSP